MPTAKFRSLLLALCGLSAATAQAHSPGESLLPDSAGVQFGAAIAWSWIDAKHPLPSPRLPGVLLTGAAADDRNGSGLEHGVLSVGLRATDWLGVQVAAGWHGEGEVHVESAWIEARHTFEQGELQLGLGRNLLPVGDVIQAAGEFDLFGLEPLAKRAAFDGQWIDDGINLNWQGFDRWQLRMNAGLWRTGKFPAAPEARWSPLLQLGATAGAWQFDAFAARIRAPGRGSFIMLSENAHSHGAPGCDQSLSEVACFEGRVTLAGLSARWHADAHPLEVSAAMVTRREHGDLHAINGAGRYRSHVNGGWIDLRWSPTERWTVGARAERLTASNRLSGSGASLLARDTGLLQSDRPAQRISLAAGWMPVPDLPTLQLTVEAGRERINDQHNPFAMLRLLWRGDFELGLP